MLVRNVERCDYDNEYIIELEKLSSEKLGNLSLGRCLGY